MVAAHFHIKGRVQGVGFRPYIYQSAKALGLKGWVANTLNGVHVEVEGEADTIDSLFQRITAAPPRLAKITAVERHAVDPQGFTAFSILDSTVEAAPDLLLPPDFAMCDKCRAELTKASDRRYQYAFITCTDCGPRYSIITGLPYDRPLTTMASFQQCPTCTEEYHNPLDRRHYSQTNSCPDCGIKLSYREGESTHPKDEALGAAIKALEVGKCVAVKGIGGYLLMVDATQAEAVRQLRIRKQRPLKPFAALYSSIAQAEGDVALTDIMKDYLSSPESPIVLAPAQPHPASGIAKDAVAPDNPYLGVMIPYAPLLLLIANALDRPLIATSGNLSHAPIVFEDDVAVAELSRFADGILSHNRPIVVPQDDSVVRFTGYNQAIWLRRSRGLAPSIMLPGLPNADENILALGGDLKAAFALQTPQQLYLSQYLGDLSSWDTHTAYEKTLEHILSLAKAQPDRIIVDQHPHYFGHQLGQALSDKWQVPLHAVQHHEAHAAALLTEHEAWASEEPMLLCSWDGTGYHKSGTVWGSEVFLWQDQELTHVAQLPAFAVLAGDQMANQPRLSALSALHTFGEVSFIKHAFTEEEWSVYHTQLDKHKQPVTTSMGRLFDAVTALLRIRNHNDFEADAAMQLEFLARKGWQTYGQQLTPYPMNNILPLSLETVFTAMQQDLQDDVSAAKIAARFHLTLVEWIIQLMKVHDVKQLGLTGGVFQNAFLVERMQQRKPDVLLHQQLPPNDESLAIGQLALYHHLPQDSTIIAQPQKQSVCV